VRLLILHVDRFAYTVTDAARSPLREAVAAPTHESREALLALAAVEREDEAAPATVARLAAEELVSVAEQLRVERVVLHPFAHLFGDLAAPAVAVAVLDAAAAHLTAAGLAVHRSPFGWFTRWDMQAKGHPLSRLARVVRAAPDAVQ
jgi:threonyl-tRNA synthetase